jgi:methionyl-tRNA synthetase
MSAQRTFYLTTPIYYVNDVPHVGHAYTTIAADALARARRLQGQRVFLLTGTDEHGQNIERIARERGIDTQAYCDAISARFRALWQRYDVRYDGFIRTTDAGHVRGVLRLWEGLRAARTPDGRAAVYEGTYAGWYCPRCEAFKTEDELRQPGNVCPDHERPCEWTEEQNYFFRLSAYTAWLTDEISTGRIRIDPEGRRNEVLALVRGGLEDFSISRARVKWGIPVPEQPDHVFYVWMDALANYITALGFAEDGAARQPYETFWEQADERLHLIGKEITRFHCLYWPAMLKAAGVPVPTRLFAHGFITKGGKKLSKTTGNVIDPVALVDQYGPDAVRYFFLREGSFGQDWDYTDTAFVGRYNADLANDFGNLVSRALTMVQRYCDGRVPARPAGPPQGATGFEALLQKTSDALIVARVFERYEALDFSGALASLWSVVGQLNQAIVQCEPWALAKDATRRAELDAFLYRLLEAVRLVSVCVSPVMPRAAERVLAMLGQTATERVPHDLSWGGLEPDTTLGRIEPLFPRLESAPAPASVAPKEKPVSEPSPSAAVPPPATPAPAPVANAAPAPLDIADFGKVELRVARVLAAEAVPKSKRLLKLQVDLGSEQRQIVSGIAETYAPEALVGRNVVLVANLKPAKLMGVESHGMVLAASIDGRAVLCGFDQDVAPGTLVK